MSNLAEIQATPPLKRLTGNESEVASSVTSGSHEATSWFVPPLVVPALLTVLFFAWIAYQAYI